MVSATDGTVVPPSQIFRLLACLYVRCMEIITIICLHPSPHKGRIIAAPMREVPQSDRDEPHVTVFVPIDLSLPLSHL